MKRTLALLLLAVPGVLGVHGQSLTEHYPEYRLERSDVVEVKYRYTPEFDQTLTVGPDGHVSLTGLGDLVAAGLTVHQFRDKLVSLSSQRLVNPEITVTLKEFDKPHVYVEGEVNTPGRVELRGDLSILDAIAVAGGFKNIAKQSEVLILDRSDAQHAVTRVVNLKKLIGSHRLEEAVQLRPGDVIYVPQDGLSKAERIAHLGQFGAIYSPLR